MRILYAIQGTGNGHISRASEVIPYLKQHGEVDILISGTQAEVTLPYPITYRFHGFSYIFGKRGGIDFWATLKQVKLIRLIRDVLFLPVKQYDLVIIDFEPVSAWACKLKNKQSFGMSHQAAFLSKKSPRPKKKDLFAEWVFKYYAPVKHKIGFHFEPYDDFIYTPVIRSRVRFARPEEKNHITVYLPAYDDKYLLSFFEKIDTINWHIFTKHSKTAYSHKHVSVIPVDNEAYTESLETCKGLITGGGFEAPTEAIFLGKKVMVIPMQNQYEQQCNAMAAAQAGCTLVERIDQGFLPQLSDWLNNAKPVKLNYENHLEGLIQYLVKSHAFSTK